MNRCGSHTGSAASVQAAAYGACLSHQAMVTRVHGHGPSDSHGVPSGGCGDSFFADVKTKIKKVLVFFSVPQRFGHAHGPSCSPDRGAWHAMSRVGFVSLVCMVSGGAVAAVRGVRFSLFCFLLTDDTQHNRSQLGGGRPAAVTKKTMGTRSLRTTATCGGAVANQKYILKNNK